MVSIQHGFYCFLKGLPPIQDQRSDLNDFILFREIDFQLLMVEREYIQRNKDSIYEELLIASDIIQFIFQIHQTSQASRRLMASTSKSTSSRSSSSSSWSFLDTLKTFNQTTDERTVDKTKDVDKDQDDVIKRLPFQDHPIIDRQLPSRPSSPILRPSRKKIKTFEMDKDIETRINFNKTSNLSLQKSNLKYLEMWSTYLTVRSNDEEFFYWYLIEIDDVDLLVEAIKRLEACDVWWIWKINWIISEAIKSSS